MPISIGERSAKGTSLVDSSHRRIAKLHMSLASKFLSLGFFCKAVKQKNSELKTLSKTSNKS